MTPGLCRERASEHLSFPVREELKQLKTLDEDLCFELKEAERTVVLTEEKCAALTCGIPEMRQLEAKEKDRVSHRVGIFNKKRM